MTQYPNDAEYFPIYFKVLSSLISAVNTSHLSTIVDIVQSSSETGGKVIVVGNGGSAAMASHVCVDLTKTAGCRAVNFNEADLITCFANDYGYENWVAKAMQAYADPDDVAILISSSGQSLNILNGARVARELGLRGIITLSGFRADNPLRGMGDINLWCDSDSYNHVEMTHHIWLLAIVDYLVTRGYE